MAHSTLLDPERRFTGDGRCEGASPPSPVFDIVSALLSALTGVLRSRESLVAETLDSSSSFPVGLGADGAWEAFDLARRDFQRVTDAPRSAWQRGFKLQFSKSPGPVRVGAALDWLDREGSN